MATVRISRTLINDVEARINTMRNRAAEEISQAASMSEEDLRSCVLTAVWLPRPDLAQQLPAEWKCAKKDFDVYLMHEGQPPNNSGRYFVNPQVSFPKEIAIPGIFRSDYRPDVFVPSTIWRNYDSICKFHDSKERVDAEHKEVVDRFRAISSQVIAFLKNSKSLNDAVKRLPTLTMYVPQSYINDMERKVERTASDKPAMEAVEVDAEMLATAAAAHILGG